MNKEFVRGVLAAAAVAEMYNSSSTHEYRLDDCIAMKLNVVGRKRPRRNKKRVENPADTFVRGVALALAEMHRLGASSSNVVDVAHDAGLDVKVLKLSGVDLFDQKELKKAGLK
jgi:hypothetical protein